ncbi:unnamed protein product [Mesocestoides corti]|uniref:CCR4-NOT transcription complex subunit 1 domain-containing protein n=1 Tax=Mesocestoides corti TaxID=53468 RepID=A0A0R3UBK8_MESCO|nr:unnamed protein product [Mesocestoides corti]
MSPFHPERLTVLLVHFRQTGRAVVDGLYSADVEVAQARRRGHNDKFAKLHDAARNTGRLSVAAYNVSAATSGAIGGTGSTSHVVSATQIMNPHQFRDVAQSVSLCSAGGLLLRYEDVDLEAVRSCINTDNLIEEITSYSQSVHCYVSCGRVASRDAAVAVSAATLLRSEPAICQLILPAIEVAANELITPLFEQCRHVTVPMVEARVRKDFALQPDPAQILRAARQMMRHLAANVSHINFHKDVSEHLVNKVTNLIWNSLITASQQEKEMVEFIVKFVLSRSIFLCIAYIEKAVAERVSREVEKNLEPDVMMRQELGPQRFLEQVTANYQNLPESMQAHPYVLQPLPPPSYEEFKQSDPGFASSTTFLSPGHIVPAQPSSQTQQQIVRRATGVLTQQPTPNTVTMRSTQHQRQQQQQLQEMALAFAGQLQLQQRQPEAQQQYLQRHSSTSATSHQKQSDGGFRSFNGSIFSDRGIQLSRGALNDRYLDFRHRLLCCLMAASSLHNPPPTPNSRLCDVLLVC